MRLMKQLIRKNSDSTEIRRCLGYFSDDKVAVFVLFIVIALSMGAGILQAWPLAVLIDSVVAPNDPQDWLHHRLVAQNAHRADCRIGGDCFGAAHLAGSLRRRAQAFTNPADLHRRPAHALRSLSQAADDAPGFSPLAAPGRYDLAFDLGDVRLPNSFQRVDRYYFRRHQNHCDAGSSVFTKSTSHLAGLANNPAANLGQYRFQPKD